MFEVHSEYRLGQCFCNRRWLQSSRRLEPVKLRQSEAKNYDAPVMKQRGSMAAFVLLCASVLGCGCALAQQSSTHNGAVVPKQPAGAEADAAPSFAGIWLPQSYDINGTGGLGYIRRSRFTVTDRSFAVSNYWGLPKDVTGTFTIDPTANPPQIDLTSDEIDCTPMGKPIQYPAGTWPGIYQFQGDLLTICFQTGSNPRRPTNFHPADPDAEVLTLRRADADFKDYPRNVTLTVTDPQGRPVAGAQVFQFMGHMNNTNDPKLNRPEWRYYETLLANAHGATTMPYEDFSAVGVRDTDRKLIGFTSASPALLQKGAATLQLQPECLLHGTIVCDELAKLGKPLGWTNVYLSYMGGRIASYDSFSGHYEFPVAPGTYSLRAYGESLQRKIVEVSVPAGQSEYEVPPIALNASRRVMLEGQPAPELVGVVGWKGHPVKLTDLRGKYVLIDFWGYWCEPCVYSMPVLIDLQEKFGDKGLAIISVHVDTDGDVDTAAKLDAKTAEFKSSLWGGNDLPFPTALSKGQTTPDGYDGLTAAQYGVLGYPTTILIDRHGKVVGEFAGGRDVKSAEAEIQKLLNASP
jgi:uncharacterized protein (TIGR03067 family)